jgi:UDP-N-acetylglucosamine diphosphorylase/glucosamine-1-phosphate N-acetyltransferase
MIPNKIINLPIILILKLTKMNPILFDDQLRDNFLPLTFTRPVAELRLGILTITKKWELYLKKSVSHFTQNYLKIKYPTVISVGNLMINGRVLPNPELIEEILNLKKGEILISAGMPVAVWLNDRQISEFNPENTNGFKIREVKSAFEKITNIWEIFTTAGKEIERDFALITHGRKSEPLSNTLNTLQPERIFLEKGAKAEFATLNPDGGFIYIGKDAEIMEGALIRGSFALGNHSIVKMGAKIYGPTVVGPHSRVGGEINNSVILGFSNKGHDGFLGNSVLGEWCNIGADSNNSNLKNNYADVKLWNYTKKGFINTGLQFCGLIMGDHSKCGINTMFNTGTVVGVSANIFGDGFPRNFVPSFSWGGAAGFTTYSIPKAFETAEKVVERRGLVFDTIEQDILKKVFELTAEFRMK